MTISDLKEMKQAVLAGIEAGKSIKAACLEAGAPAQWHSMWMDCDFGYAVLYWQIRKDQAAQRISVYEYQLARGRGCVKSSPYDRMYDGGNIFL